MSNAPAFVSGLLTAGYLVIGLYFLRFWRQSADRLFAFFAFAFLLLAIQRSLLTLSSATDDTAVWLYGLRAFAFLIIIYAIVDKNRAA